MRLRKLAHARSGDKGNTSNVVVVAKNNDIYRWLDEQLTAARVEREFEPLADGPVTRYELPQLNAFNFVIQEALDGGVTRSLRMDSHGKSLSYLLVSMALDCPDELSPANNSD